MSGGLRSFVFGGKAPVRTLAGDDGEPRWVGKDVASALEYADTSNPARIFRHVPKEWRGVNRIHTPSGDQNMITLTEQGLYFFLGRSDKPKALPFQKWLAGEVLPALRRTGRYEVPGSPHPAATPLKDWQVRCANARERILCYLLDLVDSTGKGLDWALKRVVADAQTGCLPREVQEAIPLANARGGQRGDRTLSRRTLQRWLADARVGLDNLAPWAGLKPVPMWLPLLVAILGHPPRHSLAKAHRLLVEVLGDAETAPSYHAARRWLASTGARPGAGAPVSLTGKDVIAIYGTKAALALHHINPTFPHPSTLAGGAR